MHPSRVPQALVPLNPTTHGGQEGRQRAPGPRSPRLSGGQAQPGQSPTAAPRAVSGKESLGPATLTLPRSLGNFLGFGGISAVGWFLRPVGRSGGGASCPSGGRPPEAPCGLPRCSDPRPSHCLAACAAAACTPPVRMSRPITGSKFSRSGSGTTTHTHILPPFSHANPSS